MAGIVDRGLQYPIAVWRGEIIDGVHRLRACMETGVEPKYKFLDDNQDPYEYLADANISLRDMTQNQKALNRVPHVPILHPREAEVTCRKLRKFA